MNDSQEPTGKLGANYSTWVAGGAVTLSLLGSLLAFNTAQTTMANNQAVLAKELQSVHKEVILYIDKEIGVVDSRITRHEAVVRERETDVEERLRTLDGELDRVIVRAEKNETLLILVIEGKIP